MKIILYFTSLKTIFLNKYLQKNVKTFFSFFLIVVFFLLFIPFNKVLGRNLETIYPGAEFTTIATPITRYVEYIFYLIIGLSGVFAFFSITIGGLIYLSSAGNPEEVNRAKRKIYSAIFGLAILLGSWLILNTINPSFLQLREPEVYPVPLSVSMFQGGNSLFSPILLCKQSVSNINSVLSTSTPSETLLEIKKDIEEKCYSLRGVGGIIEDEEWRKPDERWTYSRIIYIFPGNYGNHHGVILLAEDQKGQVIYNLTENIKVARPMEGEIPTAIPFTMVKEGITSFRDYIREVQLYRFVGMEGNPQNPKQDDDDYNDIYGPYYSNSIMVSTSTSPGIAAVEISLIRDTTSGEEEEEEEEEEDPVSELRLRSMDFSYYIVENLSQRCAGGSESGEKCDLNLKKPTIAIFYVCRDDIPWEDGRSCRIAVFNENNSNLNQTDMKDFCYYHVDFPCAGGMFIIAGSIGIF